MDDTGLQQTALENAGERTSPVDPDRRNFQVHEDVYRFALPYATGHVVELGSGAGYGSALLASTAERVTAFEFDPIAIEYSQKTFPIQNVSYHQADLNRPLHFEKADLIFSSNVFEHLLEVRNALQVVMDGLKSGGKFILAIPAIIEPQRLYAELLNDYHFANFSVAFWWDTLLGCFEEVGGFVQHLKHSQEYFQSAPDAKQDLSRFTRIDRCYFGAMHFFREEREYANLVFMCSRPRAKAAIADFASCPVSSLRAPIHDFGKGDLLSTPLSGVAAIGFQLNLPRPANLVGAKLHLHATKPAAGFVEVTINGHRQIVDLSNTPIDLAGYSMVYLVLPNIEAAQRVTVQVRACGLVGTDAVAVRLDSSGLHPWIRLYEAYSMQ